MQDKQRNRLQASGIRPQGEPCHPEVLRGVRPAVTTSRPPAPTRSAFTLTELLIVIAIIAVLAGLIAAAAVNAMRAANRGRITLEIKNISGALENFKNDYGAYPPNGMNINAITNPASGTPAALVRSDFRRMFKKAFPRHQEPQDLIDAIAGIPPQNNTIVTSGPLTDGLTAAESLYFWLGGFSSDEQYPLSGVGGPSFLVVTGGLGEVLEDRNRRYEFELERLGPRTDDGLFDQSTVSTDGKGRFIEYTITVNGIEQDRRINFWRYTPSGSEQPLVYFDVSRYKPTQYDFWAANPATGTSWVVAFKQLRSGAAAIGGSADNVAFVDQGKYQILHPGLDDSWAAKDAEGVDQFRYMSVPAMKNDNKIDQLLLYPDGPFIGEIGDTLTSFTDGTLEDAVEE